MEGAAKELPQRIRCGLAIQELQYFGAYATRELNDGAYQAEAYEARPKCNYAPLLGVEVNATPAVSVDCISCRARVGDCEIGTQSAVTVQQDLRFLYTHHLLTLC